MRNPSLFSKPAVRVGVFGASRPTGRHRARSGGRPLLGLAAALVAMGPGCKSAPAKDPTPLGPVLVSPAEQAGLEAKLFEELGKNRARHCPRPVLREPGLAGRPDPLIVALVEPEGELGRCVEAVIRSEALWRPEKGGASPSDGALPRLRPDPVSSGGRTEEELARGCAGLGGAISRAVRFRSACSPYLPGRRRLPELGPIVRLLEGAALLARKRSRGDPSGAAMQLLETLWLHQDLCRGGVPWIWPYVLRAPLRLTVAVLAELLGEGRLDLPTLRTLEQALAALARSEPPAESYLRGELLTVELGSYLGPLMPPGWIPPGGEPLPGFHPGAGAPRRAFGSPRQDLLLAWLAHRRRSEEWIRKCPARVAPFRCLEAMEAYGLEVGERVRHLEERWRVLEERLHASFASGQGKGPDPGHARRAVLEWLVSLGPTTGADHLRRAAERGFWLAAVRVHVGVLIAQAGALEPLSLGRVLELEPARRDPFWGEPLVVEGTPGAMRLRPPRALSPAGEPRFVYVMSWPVSEAPRPPGPRRPGSP